MSTLSQTFNQDASGNIGIAATSLPLPTGAATSANQTTANASLSSIDAGIPTALGAATIANSMPVNIASDQVVPVSATALPLPAGASTSALQTSGNATLTSITGQLPSTLGQKTSANSLAVVLASDQSTVPVSTPNATVGTITSVSGSATSVSILASNTARKGAIVTNDSTAILYLALSSSTASTSAYSVKLYPNASYLVDFLYTGAMTGIWAAAAGAARVTEFT